MNAILNDFAYTFRQNAIHDSIPERAADDYVLESPNGKRVRVTMPWVFVPTQTLAGEQALPLSSSTAEFVERCIPLPVRERSGAGGAPVHASPQRQPEVQ